MKKFIYSSLILGSAFALASCSADEPGLSKTDGPLTLTVQLPGESATRFATGSSVDILYYTILNEDGTTVLASDSQPWEKGATSATVTLDLIPSQNYQVVFFAMNSNATGYQYNPATAAFTVDYDQVAINNDIYDAFCAKVPGINTAYDTTENPINLSRPFAQINIGTNDLGSKIVTSYGLDNYTTTFAVEATNLATGVSYLTSGSNNMTYTPATDGFSKEVTDLTDTAGLTDAYPVEGYKYLDMMYLLVNPGTDTDGQALLSATFTTSISGGINVQEVNLSSLPAKANYQTNVYGKLLTDSKDFNVQIAPAFEGSLPEVTVSEPEEALDALNNNESLVFNGTTDALDLSNLSNTEPVMITLAKGASVGSIKVGSKRSLEETAPVTIKVAKDVKFPEIVATKDTPIYNLTLVGDPNAPVENASNGISFYGTKIATIKNLTFNGIHFEGNGINTQYVGQGAGNNMGGTVDGLTIENCVFTNLVKGAFSTQQYGGSNSYNTNFIIRNNTISFASSGVNPSENGINIAQATPGYFIVENNTITGATYHGITISPNNSTAFFSEEAMKNSVFTVSGNTVTNCGHDGIKIGYPCGTVNIFQNNVTPGEYGIRVTRFFTNALPTINIYDNKINMTNVVDTANEKFGAINVSANDNPGTFILNVYGNIKNGGNPSEWFQLQGLTPEAGSNYSTPFSN